MRFLMNLYMKEGIGTPPRALIEKMDEHITAGFKSGTLLDAGGLYGTEDSKQVALRGGEVTVSDGPFAEAKEVVGGYAIVDVRDEAQAVEEARQMIEVHRLWPEWEGFCEVRRIAEEPPTPTD